MPSKPQGTEGGFQPLFHRKLIRLVYTGEKELDICQCNCKFIAAFRASLVLETVMNFIGKSYVSLFFLLSPCKNEESKSTFYLESQVDFCIALGSILLCSAGFLGCHFIQLSARFRAIDSEYTFLNLLVGDFDYDIMAYSM